MYLFLYLTLPRLPGKLSESEANSQIAKIVENSQAAEALRAVVRVSDLRGHAGGV